jgi:glucuronate isomerase
MPVIDYHCHLSPKEIAENINFNNLTQAWLYGDHYKWRAMRANGVMKNISPVMQLIGKNLSNGLQLFLYIA